LTLLKVNNYIHQKCGHFTIHFISSSSEERKRSERYPSIWVFWPRQLTASSQEPWIWGRVFHHLQPPTLYKGSRDATKQCQESFPQHFTL